jgi:GNAT superfamily N-acetyltransferase
MTPLDISNRPEIVSKVAQSDVKGFTKLMNNQAPHAQYANYYFAMLAAFLPDTNTVLKNDSEVIIGGYSGLYDLEFRSLLLSHIAVDLEDKVQRNMALKDLLGESFKIAAGNGLSSVKAELDSPSDQDIEDVFYQTANKAGLSASISFRGADHIKPSLPDFGDGFDSSDVRREDIEYHQACEDNAYAVWSLVNDIHDQAVADPNKSGLDVYGLSNYERLFRETPQTSAVATYKGKVIGFATGFGMKEEDQRGLFLWQTGVHSDFQGKGVGTQVERLILNTVKPDYAMWSVESSNGAANRTAQKKAEYMGWVYKKPGAIGEEALGCHEPEIIYVTAPSDQIERLSHTIKRRLG